MTGAAGWCRWWYLLHNAMRWNSIHKGILILSFCLSQIFILCFLLFWSLLLGNFLSVFFHLALQTINKDFKYFFLCNFVSNKWPITKNEKWNERNIYLLTYISTRKSPKSNNWKVWISSKISCERVCKKMNMLLQKLFLPIISDIDNVCNRAIPVDIEKTIEVVAARKEIQDCRKFWKSGGGRE